jgi:hypothetical protein
MTAMRLRLLSYGLHMAVGVALATLIACSSLSESTLADRNGPGSSGAEGQDSASPSANNPGSDAGQGAPTGSGLVIVHSAAFPSFRLCFSKHPELRPQPDSKVMPEANVVGVEVGSAVRIEGIDNPGKVYVIHRKNAALTIGGPDEPNCGQLICEGTITGPKCLDVNQQYYVAGEINESVGKNRVDALTISGCGSGGVLSNIRGFDPVDPNKGFDPANCGTGWDSVKGNLQPRIVQLTPTATTADDSRLPIQVMHVSEWLDNAKKGGTLEVTFGKFTEDDKPLKDPVEANPPLFKPGTQKTLLVDQKVETLYGEQGFRIAMRNSPTVFSGDQSLAKIQELSSPSDVPNQYYKAATNYALLLLGDPNMKPTTGGNPNPYFDERRAVHLLAVPILEPKSAETDGGTSSEGGSTTGDGG